MGRPADVRGAVAGPFGSDDRDEHPRIGRLARIAVDGIAAGAYEILAGMSTSSAASLGNWCLGGCTAPLTGPRLCVVDRRTGVLSGAASFARDRLIDTPKDQQLVPGQRPLGGRFMLPCSLRPGPRQPRHPRVAGH